MRRNINFLAIVLLCLFSNLGCSEHTFESGFKSSDAKEMNELKTALTKAGIPFREDQDGFIRYQSQHEAKIHRLKDEIDNELNGGIAVKYSEKASNVYLKSLLDSQGMKYRVEPRADGEWIRWYPENSAQRLEIETKVLQHAQKLDCLEPKEKTNSPRRADEAEGRYPPHVK